MEIPENIFKHLNNENLKEEYWILELGIKYVYHNVPEGVHYWRPYPEIGRAFWNKIEGTLIKVLCENGKPKEYLNEIIDGEYRNLVETLIPILVTTISIPFAIAIPIVALIIKKGLKNLCSISPNQILSNEEILEVIENKSIEKEL